MLQCFGVLSVVNSLNSFNSLNNLNKRMNMETLMQIDQDMKHLYF